jgi:hypothetical protein
MKYLILALFLLLVSYMVIISYMQISYPNYFNAF